MGCDLLDEGNFSPKEREILSKAGRILEMKVRGESDVFNSPTLVRQWLRVKFSGLDREMFGVLFLDPQNRLIDFEVLFTGTLTQTSVFPREVVKAVLQHNAGAVLVVHNHPSGFAEPSRADEILTQALALVDTQFLDHFIVAGSTVLSFAEMGLI
jgi:DNA repair protein RadC